MSGHNKWSTIKHKKGAADAKRGKIFSRLGKEITVAARNGGGDPDMNPRLRSAVSAARAANMPNDNIGRAIKKGTGELAGQALEEIVYEGYGAGGVAIIVNCLTDNRNRTASDIRVAFSKNNGNLGGSGSVNWMFHRKARFVVEGEMADEDKLLELLLESEVDVDEVEVTDNVAEIIAPPDAFNDILSSLETANISVSESGVTLIPENTMEVTEVSIARQVLRLIDALEELDDAQMVSSNLDISEDILKQLEQE